MLVALGWLALAGSPEGMPVDAWMDAVVFLEQGSTVCAGVRLDPDGTVLTAYHCVAAGGRPRVTLRDGTSAVGWVGAVDRGRDLAVVHVDGLSGGWLPLASAPPSLGAEVWALGHPSGADLPSGFYTDTLRFSVAAGVVSAVGSEALQVSAPVNPGNSGGPVVDARGEVVGVVSRRLAGQSLSFAGRATHARPLVGAPERMGALGGTVALELALSAMDRGQAAVGPKVELAFRDRVVLEGSAALPLSARWTAARFGSTRFLRGEVHGGLRQRLGRGSWTTRLDAWAGVALREELRRPEHDPLALSTQVAWVPVAGGAVRVRSVGFELGVGLAGPDEPVGRAAVVLRVPGVISVF